MFPLTSKLGNSHLGASTFFASAHPSESCGSNGLPLTPNSIRIYGRARTLNLVNHPHLCTYVDVHRGKHERIIVVQEYYQLNLGLASKRYATVFRKEEKVVNLIHEVLQALIYLNKFGSVCHNLSPETILIDPFAHVKLFDYGLYYMTEAGSSVSFTIGNPKYLPPEILINYFVNDGQPLSSVSGTGNPSLDSWSVGLIFLEIFLKVNFFENEHIGSVVEHLLTLAVNEQEFLAALAESQGYKYLLENLSSNVRDFLAKCLTVNSELRPAPADLIKHPIFDHCSTPHLDIVLPQFPAIDPSLCIVDFNHYTKNGFGVFQENAKEKLLNYPQGGQSDENTVEQISALRVKDFDHLKEKNMRLIYYLWQLAGGNVEQELKKQKLIYTRPSVISLPRIMCKEGELFGGGFQRQDLLPTSVVILPLDNLRNRLAHIPPYKYYPLLTKGECGMYDLETSSLPLVIREKDVEYQFHRVLLFERLLKAYPYKLDAIIREARKDTPPFYRSLIWASLLRVDGNVKEIYDEIDKETPTTTDRQIEVDIPRCHQYDELLSSPQGHLKFTKILKAWVVSHPHLVYWQGLDSLCAPFLYLNFENEALAYACLSSFISKYLHKFFLRDNSAVIQEYLAKFSHLISFHDPILFNHLHTIGFIPELYAIPWFLTMFTHVFPLHKIFLLWDTLLLGESSLPLCIGIALLRQLKDRLLQYGFNECILLFSDMPDINMEQVVRDAVEIFCATPASLTFRMHDKKNEDLKNNKYSTDIDIELIIDEISLSDLKKEFCGRISGAELLELISQERTSKGRKPKVLLLDIRPSEEFAKGSLSEAISMPFDSIFLSDDIIATTLLEVEAAIKGKILVVIGSQNYHQQVLKVAHALLSHGFPRVCTLHRGIEVFRKSGHIIVPSI